MTNSLLKSPTVGQYLFAALIDLALVGSFYIWQVQGSDGAGNLYLFLAWVIALGALLVGFTGCWSPALMKPTVSWPIWWKWFERARTTGMILSAAWLGHEALAVFLLCAVIFIGAAKAKLAAEEVAP